MGEETREHRESIAEIKNNLIRQETLMDAMGEDQKDLAIAVQNVVNHVQETSGKIYKRIEERDKFDRNRLLNIFAIVVPIVIVVAGALLVYIEQIDSSVQDLYKERINDAYARGISEGRAEGTTRRIGRLERQWDAQFKQKEK